MLSPREVADCLRGTVAALRAELGALPAPVLAFHPAPGEWCAKEVVGHLIEAERRGFAGRIRIILAGDAPALEAWDVDAVARARRDCESDWTALVTGLGAADLARAGRHPTVGLLRVDDLLQEWVHHDGNHLRQILANVQAYVWPAMGNAQRFSRPG